MRAERTHGPQTLPWVMACLLPENRPLPSAPPGRAAGRPGAQAGHRLPAAVAIPSLCPKKHPGDTAAPRLQPQPQVSSPEEEADQWASGDSWPDVGEVTRGHTHNSRPLAPYREGILMGMVLLVCRGRRDGRTKRPLSTQGGCPGWVALANWPCTQLLPVEVRARGPGSGGVGKKGAVGFPEVLGSSHGSEPPPRP